MKKLLILLTLLFTACTNYYCLIKTGTTNTQSKDDTYTYETDTVKVVYWFWDDKGVMAFTLYNKSNVPIYVDWKSSEFIANNSGINYWIDEQQVHTEVYSNALAMALTHSIAMGTSGSTANSTIYKPDRITSIAPKTQIQIARFQIIRSTYHASYSDTGKTFNAGNTPYLFRNYLVLSKTEDLKTPFYVDNGFFVSRYKIVKGSEFEGKIVSYDRNYSPIREQLLQKPTDFYVQQK